MSIYYLFTAIGRVVRPPLSEYVAMPRYKLQYCTLLQLCEILRALLVTATRTYRGCAAARRHITLGTYNI